MAKELKNKTATNSNGFIKKYDYEDIRKPY